MITSRNVANFIVVARLSRAVGMTVWGLCRSNKQSRPEFNRLTWEFSIYNFTVYYIHWNIHWNVGFFNSSGMSYSPPLHYTKEKYFNYKLNDLTPPPQNECYGYDFVKIKFSWQESKNYMWGEGGGEGAWLITCTFMRRFYLQN